MDESLLGRAAAAEVGRLKNLRILVLDEQEITRRVLAVFLEWSGASVTCADTLSEALAFLSVRRFDAIVTDIELPGEARRHCRRLLAGVAGPNAAAPILSIDGRAADEPTHAAGMMLEIGSLIDPGRIRFELETLSPIPPRVAA